MSQADQLLSPRGRPLLVDAKQLASPSLKDIYLAAGIFQSLAILDIKAKEVQIRIHQLGRDKDALDTLLTFFGGRIARLQDVPKGERYVWTCHGARARGFLWTVYSLLSSAARKADVLEILRQDAVMSGMASASLPNVVAIKSAAAKHKDIIVPKHHMELHADYDSSVFLNIEDVQPGEPYVFRLPSSSSLDAFIADATSRGYVVLSQVELTVSLTRPHDYE